MMSCKPVFYLLYTALLLTGCERPTTAPDPAAPGSPAPAGPYFDVRGLLDGQVRRLTADQPAVEKHVSLRGGATETAQVPRVKWADELQLFYQADINKAALRGAYALDSARLPGGVLRRVYTLKTNQDNAPVRRLAVLSRGGQPEQLDATLRQDNVLFSAQKRLSLTLQNGQLRAYGVRGVQKLLLFDTLRYQTEARLQ